MGFTHHNGISVYGSGLAIGAKNLESYIGPSGADGYLRFDGGTFSRSGMSYLSVSTRLSSIVFAEAMPVFPYLGLSTLSSGYISDVRVGFSGGAIDFNMLHNASGGAGKGGMTSAGTSSIIAWFAFGK